MAHLLITGGAGFIGSHTCVVLLEAGHHLLVFDDLSNSSPVALERVAELAGVALGEEQLKLICGDIRDAALLDRLFTEAEASDKPIEAVIHFAGLKAVGESVANPLRYWDVNVVGSQALLSTMDAHTCRTVVFSSTSTVYGEPERFPLTETTPIAPIHPYAQTKLAVEQMLNALAARGDWRVSVLRYFNPVGAHPSGRIGEDPLGIPNNLFPFITQVAAGRLEKLKVFGDDYSTPDGTGIRDYLHVMDLAEAHKAAVEHLLQAKAPHAQTLNLGTGQGLSVLDLVKGFEAATGITIPYEIVARRPGDVPKLEACPKRAEEVLGWKSKRTLADMCRDGWAWQAANPRAIGVSLDVFKHQKPQAATLLANNWPFSHSSGSIDTVASPSGVGAGERDRPSKRRPRCPCPENRAANRYCPDRSCGNRCRPPKRIQQRKLTTLFGRQCLGTIQWLMARIQTPLWSGR